MRKEVIESLLSDVKMLRYCRIKETGVPEGVWFVFEVRPRPPLDEIQKVIYDIDNLIGAQVLYDGSLRHASKCSNDNHNLDGQLERAVKAIGNQVFRIALWEGLPQFLNWQPIAISLSPEISYLTYPEHPHISSGRPAFDFYVPDFLCYTDNPEGLGSSPYNRIDNAIQDVCMWLFRHQVWLATKSIGEARWIGPEVKAQEEDQFLYFRDPYSQCYCGKGKLYHMCHLQQDFLHACATNPVFNTFRTQDNKINLREYHKWWIDNRSRPQNIVLNKLRRLLQ